MRRQTCLIWLRDSVRLLEGYVVGMVRSRGVVMVLDVGALWWACSEMLKKPEREYEDWC
jgi:hypothetical protein